VTGRSSAARRVRLTLLHESVPATRPKVTRRELEVLELVADGMSTREIAQRLWVTDETVKTHVRRLHDRLGARTRAHAVAIAFRSGILRP
jgi:DNA-binding CsgD family transcriptional regulator